MAPFGIKNSAAKKHGKQHHKHLVRIEKKSGTFEGFVRAKMFKTTNWDDATQFVDIPYNVEQHRYHLAEEDTEATNIINPTDEQEEKVMSRGRVKVSAHLYRVVIQPEVTLSLHDRDKDVLSVDQDKLTVSGNPTAGYGLIRASHSVAHGSWYFEVKFVAQPDDSHVRVGWALANAPMGACVGYTKFSYGWRSKRGTAFHDGYGKRYHHAGYKEGDVLGCLIELPSFDDQIISGIERSAILPNSKKGCHLIAFRSCQFFEEYQMHWANAEANLEKYPQNIASKISFFLNGEECGTAFDSLYRGHYFPAVSLFHSAKVCCNFGPNFQCLPEAVRRCEAKPMSDRPAQMAMEQLEANRLYLEKNVPCSSEMEM